jgi:hypothetical protein
MAATPLERTPGSHARLCLSTPTDRGLYLDGQIRCGPSRSQAVSPESHRSPRQAGVSGLGLSEMQYLVEDRSHSGWE